MGLTGFDRMFEAVCSMQAHEGRALTTALKPISGEETYAMAA